MQDYLWVSNKTGNKYWTREEARNNRDGNVVKYFAVDEKEDTTGFDYFWGIEIVYKDNEQSIITACSRKNARGIMKTIKDPHKEMKSIKIYKYVEL